ncbi:MAG: UDP-glucose/GDP-mannose dehydrogenase family protein [Chloroflexi bacterium]|nr:UDP-glucose/GDP-mannose dehydrogenase family protein [Chloroflexota bacterium]
MKISIIGLGYVGSVAAAGLASDGHDVLGIDVSAEKVNGYRKGDIPIYEAGLSELVNEAVSRGNLRFLHPSEVSEPLGDVILIAVGTPTTDTGAADLSQVRSAIAWVKEKQPDGGVIVVKSTIPPGTGERLCASMLNGSPFKYVSNPEFLREGQAIWDWFHPDRVVIGGDDAEAIDLVKALYKGVDAPYVVTDITSAEMIKYAANAFLATKISFVNEIAALCDRLGATYDDVSEGIALDPRIGPSFLKAGVGYGGSCFPKDVRALDQLALTNGHNFELLRSVITVNNRQRLLPFLALRERFGQLSELNVGILGLAFKPNTDDVREAPSLDLIRVLVEDGASVSAYDPEAINAASKVLPSVVDLKENLMDCAYGVEALVLMTEWPQIVDADWEEILAIMKPPRFLFDGRNALDASCMRGLGFEYRGVGRPVKSKLKQIVKS